VKVNVISALCAALAFLCTFGAPVRAASELKVLATPNMRPILPDLASAYERAGGTKLAVTYAAPPKVTAQVEAGEKFDVVITLQGMADSLAKAGRLGNLVTVAHSPVVVAIPAGKPRPDISSASAFKQALLNAHTIVHSNGGPSGAMTERVFKSMGIEEQMRPKVKLVPPGGQALPAAIASGEADLGIDQLAVLQNKPGIDVVGALPKEFAAEIVMDAGVSASAADRAAALKFLQFLKSPEAAMAIKAHGMLTE
jgi:molybdate transport system substrate-binding protein